MEELEKVTGRTIARLHIVGGGSQSALLNQFAANATGRPVLAGPIEATALGNVLIQAIALGHLASLGGLREVVRASFGNRALRNHHRRFTARPGKQCPRALCGTTCRIKGGRRRKKAVILSAAGKHGRSRRNTSNIRRSPSFFWTCCSRTRSRSQVRWRMKKKDIGGPSTSVGHLGSLLALDDRKGRAGRPWHQREYSSPSVTDC